MLGPLRLATSLVAAVRWLRPDGGRRRRTVLGAPGVERAAAPGCPGRGDRHVRRPAAASGRAGGVGRAGPRAAFRRRPGSADDGRGRLRSPPPLHHLPTWRARRPPVRGRRRLSRRCPARDRAHPQPRRRPHLRDCRAVARLPPRAAAALRRAGCCRPVLARGRQLAAVAVRADRADGVPPGATPVCGHGGAGVPGARGHSAQPGDQRRHRRRRVGRRPARLAPGRVGPWPGNRRAERCHPSPVSGVPIPCGTGARPP